MRRMELREPLNTDEAAEVFALLDSINGVCQEKQTMLVMSALMACLANGICLLVESDTDRDEAVNAHIKQLTTGVREWTRYFHTEEKLRQGPVH